MSLWRPTPQLDEAARQGGLRAFQADGVCSQIRDSLLGGPLLVGYALVLGASNTVIGLLAAVGPATQFLQLPTVALIERWRARKVICWWAALISRLSWVLVLTVPWLLPASLRVTALFALLFLAAGFGTVAGAAWMPWIRDLLPEEQINRLFARRMSVGAAVGALLGLTAGLAVDALQRWTGSALGAYTTVLGLGTASGLLGLVFLARIPEPLMPVRPHRPWLDVVRAPFRHRDFRALIVFLATWTFAVHLSTPFFSVYLLRRLGLPIAAVVALTVLSQATTAAVLRAWGAVADRFQTRTVLSVSCAGFLLTVGCWPLAGALETPWVVLAVLGAVHVLAGLTTAGVNLCIGTVALQVAPRGEAAGYLATNALVCGAAAALAPLLAGGAADLLETQRLSITVQWTSTLAGETGWALRPIDLHGLDFLFVATVVVGLYAIHRILAVAEQGPADRRAVLAALADEVRERMSQPLRAITTVPAVRDLVYYPFSMLSRVLPERRQPGRRARARPGSGATGSAHGKGASLGTGAGESAAP